MFIACEHRVGTLKLMATSNKNNHQSKKKKAESTDFIIIEHNIWFPTENTALTEVGNIHDLIEVGVVKLHYI